MKKKRVQKSRRWRAEAKCSGYRAEGIANTGQQSGGCRKHFLDIGLDLAGKDRGSSLGANGNGYRIAVDHGRRQEFAGLKIVDDIGECPGRLAQCHGTQIGFKVVIGAIDKTGIGNVIGVQRPFPEG